MTSAGITDVNIPVEPTGAGFAPKAKGITENDNVESARGSDSIIEAFALKKDSHAVGKSNIALVVASQSIIGHGSLRRGGVEAAPREESPGAA